MNEEAEEEMRIFAVVGAAAAAAAADIHGYFRCCGLQTQEAAGEAAAA